jgi:hypothetical protein
MRPSNISRQSRFLWMAFPLFALLLPTFAKSADFQARKQRHAFSDKRFDDWSGVAAAVAGYYISHRKWPSTREQVRAQALQMVAIQPPLPAGGRPSAADINALFARFSRIDLKRQRNDLLVTVRCDSRGKAYTDTAIFHPRKTAGEIIQTITLR